jgi:hypothetical protein
MKRTILVTLLLLVSAFAVAMKTTGSAERNRGEASAADKWEYLAVAGPATTNFSPTGNPNMRKLEEGGFAREGFVLEQHLDKLGARGWELVSVAGLPTDPVYYFKRRK